MKTISIKEILKKSWSYLKVNIWFFVSYTFIYFVLSSVLNGNDKGPGSFLIFIAGMILSVLFSIGMYRAGLFVEENKELNINIFKSNPQLFLKYLLLNILSSFITVVGLVFFIIPGVIFAIRLSLSNYVLLDKNLGPIDSIKESWRITKGFSSKIFVFLLAYIGLVILSVLTFGIGLVLTVPYIYITGAVLYKTITQIKNENLKDAAKDNNQI